MTTDFASIMSTVYPPDRESVELVVKRALETEQGFEMEYRVVQSGGGVRWKASRGRAAPGYTKRLRGITLDINERKLAEIQAAILQGGFTLS